MADLLPFRGLRFQADRVGGLGRVIAPPYDVISADGQAALYDRGPYNVIRLEYGRDPAPARYANAAAALATWREDGALAAEARPALYRYTQRFMHDGRTYERRAVIGRVKLEPLERGIIRPHEYTMTGPKEDRLALLRATRTNTSPVFSLLADPAGDFAAALRDAPVEASVEGEDITGQSHQIEVITEAAAIGALTAALAGRPLYIADGHHRYETALAYQRERPEDPAAGALLMAIAATDDPGLLILPIHRLVRPRTPAADVDEVLGERFAVEDLGEIDAADILERTRVALDAQRGGLTLAALGVQPGRVLLLRVGDQAAVEAAMPAERSAAWKALAVNVLQFGILEPLLGIDAEALAGGDHVTFTEDLGEAFAAVRQGHVPLAFAVPATRPDEIIAVADTGDRMPQKSTYFYPKLGTGLVLNSLDL